MPYVEVEYSENSWQSYMNMLDAYGEQPSADQEALARLKEALEIVKIIVDNIRRQIVFNCVTLAIFNLIAGFPPPSCLENMPELNQ